MHFSVLPPRSAPARLALLTVCALLPAFTREAAAGGVQRPSRARSGTLHLPSSPSPPPASESTPYLLVGPPPRLRFAEPVPIAAPAPTAAPDPPGPNEFTEEIITLDQVAVAPPPATHHAGAPATLPAAPSPASSLVAEHPASVPIPTEPPQIGIAILPDDTPRAIRAEDVLVYFRFPLASPSDSPPPRSSATYQQQ